MQYAVQTLILRFNDCTRQQAASRRLCLNQAAFVRRIIQLKNRGMMRQNR